MTNQPQELFKINEGAEKGKKFSLTEAFDTHADSYGISSKQFTSIKEELIRKWNQRLDSGVKVSIVIDQVIRDIPIQINKEKQLLAEKSKAFTGVVVPQEAPVQVAQNTPSKDRPSTGNILQDAIVKTTAGQNFIKAFKRSDLGNI